MTPRQMCIFIGSRPLDPRRREQEQGPRRRKGMSVCVARSVCPLRGVIILLCVCEEVGLQVSCNQPPFSYCRRKGQGSNSHLSGLSYYASLPFHQGTFRHQGASEGKELIWGSSPKIK